MRALVIGSKGTLGQAIVRLLQQQNVEVLTGGRSSCDLNFDAYDQVSVQKAFKTAPKFHSVICAFGAATSIKPLEKLRVEDFQKAAQSKLWSQIGITIEALHHLEDGGSITLTAGSVHDELIEGGSVMATINRALIGFVRACDAPNIRINVVSPTLLKESEEKYRDYFVGINAVSTEKAATAYIRSVFGRHQGANFKVYGDKAP